MSAVNTLTHLEAHLRDRCTIARSAYASDGMGGRATGAPLTLASDLPCLLAPSSYRPAELQLGERVAGVTLWTLALPPGTDVRRDDRVSLSGATYRVLGLLTGGQVERRLGRLVLLAQEG